MKFLTPNSPDYGSTPFKMLINAAEILHSHPQNKINNLRQLFKKYVAILRWKIKSLPLFKKDKLAKKALITYRPNSPLAQIVLVTYSEPN